MKQKKLCLLIGTMFAMPFVGNSALAQQQGTAATGDDVQQVTVTGISAAARSALNFKEMSNNMVEAIVAEDIGKLPDTTIAESLARLPGMNSGIDRGNASQVVAEGLGPRFIAATLDGRELATPEPNRAIRFEQFPAQSLVGANVYKTQSAELIEGGVATTIDLLTIRPLQYKSQQLTLQADGLYSPMGNDIGGAPTSGERLGGLYLDQFNNNTLGFAFAFNYEDQPSLVRDVENWGFNETNSASITGNGVIDKTPWGFQDEAKRGDDQRSSVLTKIEWKPSSNALITGDMYYEKQAIREPGLQTWTGDLGNWNGYENSQYSNLDIRNGYVVGATVTGVNVINNDYMWVQDSSTLASGLNAKIDSDGWKLEGDLSNSLAMRSSAWRDLSQTSLNPGTITWDMPGNGVQNFSFGQNTGNPAIYGAPVMNINTDGNVKDDLSALQLNASRQMEGFGDVSRIKFGARFTTREKSYNQTTWSVNPTSAIPLSDYQTVNVAGMPSFAALTNFDSTVYSAFGGNVFNPEGRTPTQSDLLAGWDVKEHTDSVYAQADLDGKMMNLDYRGNVGLRLAHASHTSDGMQSANGGNATPIELTGSDTEVLPSLNLVLMLDPQQQQQIRFGAARAMSRAPLDELRSSLNFSTGTSGSGSPILTGSAGNPSLKPMLADQLDLAYQWYFDKDSLLSAGVFFKKMDTYIKIEDNATTVNGQNAMITQSVNTNGGDVRGIELVYQQAFKSLPAPFNGLGMFSNFTYTTSNITENISGGLPFPVDGLMRDNGGFTLWYQQNGYEARLAANYHSAFTRDPGWTTGAFVINGAETHVSFMISKQITPQLQVHFGADNITDQKVVYTTPNEPYEQQVFDFGRQYNLGLVYKM